MRTKLLMLFIALCGITQGQSYQWANPIGNSGFDEGYSITVDGTGNVYVTGHFEGTTDFDPGAGTATLTATGSYDIFFAKYDLNGNYLWAKSIGSSGFDIGFKMAIDGAGNVYLTGIFQNTVDFDPGAGTSNLTSTGSYDVFFGKYDTNGNYVWAKKIGGGNSDYGYGISADGLGNVYISGNFQGTADFDPGVGTANLTSTGLNDAYFGKYDSNGNYVWAKKIGSTAFDESTSLAVDVTGNVHITGHFQGTTDFDPGVGTATINPMGSYDIFFAKYDNNGNYLWAKTIGSTSNDYGRSIALDGTGNVYITGNFQNAPDFDPSAATATLTSLGQVDVYFAKYDNNGNYLWAKSIGGTGDDQSSCIVLDGTGNIYLTGWFQNTVDFDPGAGTANLTFLGSYDIFFGKYDNSGNYLWAYNIGSSASDYGRSIAVDVTGNVYLTGYFQSTADFNPSAGTANLTATGFTDIFYAKYSAAGVGIDQTFLGASTIVISPNPSAGVFTIQSKGNIVIYNSLGEKIFSNELTLDRTEMDLSNQPNGIYFINIKTEQGTTTKKIIINK